MSTEKTIALRTSVALNVGLQPSYVLARIEQEAAGGWIQLPVKRIAEVMAPIGCVSGYKALQSLIEAGLVIAKRGTDLGIERDATLHYRVNVDGLASFEAAHGV